MSQKADAQELYERVGVAEGFATKPKWAYGYARRILEGRFLAGEPYLKKRPHWAYNYALWVIGGRWPEAEPYIMSLPETAALYAIRILKTRWPEAEDVILQAPEIEGSDWAPQQYAAIFGLEYIDEDGRGRFVSDLG
jgi:hypothetical protein